MKLKKYKRKLRVIYATAFFITATAVTNANAALTWGSGGIELDTTDVDSAMGLIAVGLATLWGYRKVIKTLNKS